MDSKIYGSMCGKYTESSNITHHSIPSHNMRSLESMKNVLILDSDDDFNVNFQNSVNRNLISFPFCKPFPFKVDLNTILFPGSGLTDEARDLIKNKLKWKQKLTFLTPKDYNYALKNLNRVKKKKLSQLNLDLVKYLKHFQKDPEPNFDSDYNWLYTGGNIAAATLMNKYFLINADDMESSKILNILQYNGDFDKLKRRTYYHMENYSPLFQVVCRSRNEGLLIAARQKKKIYLLRFDGKDDVKKIWSKESKDMRFLISCDLSGNEDKIAIADNKSIEIFDLETGGKFFEFITNNNESATWYQVVFDNFNKEIYLADHCCLRIFDIRVKSSKPCLIFKPDNAVNDCESLCNIIKSGFNSNIIYVASSHCLLQVDVRSGKASQKWTHLMQSAPLFGKTCLRNGEEIVVIQSENADEVISVVNEAMTDTADQFSSNSAPYVFSNTKEALRIAHYNGICLHPSISERFDFAVTGLETFVDKNNDVNLFTTNSGGDIMKTKLKRKGDEKVIEEIQCHTEEIVRNMKSYEEHCKIINSKETIVATEIVNMSPLLNDLLIKNSKKKKFHVDENYWRYSEIFSPESLCYCKDYLAERFLHVWGHKTKDLQSDFEEEEKVEKDDDEIESETSTRMKVEKWMEKCGT